MAGKGKGVDYYKSTYTHQQLWDMLHEGDDYSVERAGSIWVSAASGMKAAREELATHVSSLRLQWTGPASDEFDGRMNLVKQYSIESEDGMKTAGEYRIPGLAEALKAAQESSAPLNPAYIEEYEDWVESKKHVDPASAEAQSKKTQWQQEYEADLNKNHGDLAQIVADLGDRYAQEKEEYFAEVPPPPPSDMPGNTTYTKPTGGVFSETSLNSSDSLGSVPSEQSADLDGDGFADSPDDLDPVDSDWNPGSYDDVDTNVTGGLAVAPAAWAAPRFPVAQGSSVPHRAAPARPALAVRAPALRVRARTAASLVRARPVPAPTAEAPEAVSLRPAATRSGAAAVATVLVAVPAPGTTTTTRKRPTPARPGCGRTTSTGARTTFVAKSSMTTTRTDS
jgi:hypothetical protein